MPFGMSKQKGAITTQDRPDDQLRIPAGTGKLAPTKVCRTARDRAAYGLTVTQAQPVLGFHRYQAIF